MTRGTLATEGIVRGKGGGSKIFYSLASAFNGTRDERFSIVITIDGSVPRSTGR
jgi:hypothetical protein